MDPHAPQDHPKSRLVTDRPADAGVSLTP